MLKRNKLEFESNEVKAYVQQLQAENGILRQANDEKNELLIKLGCPTKATAKRKVFTLEQQLKRKEQELEYYKIQFNADTKEMEGYLNEIGRHIESIEYLRNQLRIKEQEIEKLKKELESTKGLVTVGNRQLAEALLELQNYKDNEQQEKEMQKLYNKFNGSSLIEKSSPYGN